MFISETPFQKILSALVVGSSLAGCIGGTRLAPTNAADLPPATTVLDRQRGQLLYDAQCVTCHATQMHWRDKSIVGSWSDLLAQVDRWQENAGLQWCTEEIGDVTAYLNVVFYKMPCSVPGCQGQTSAAIGTRMSMADAE